MRLSISLGLLLAVVGPFAAPPTQDTTRQGESATYQKALEVTIVADKREYKTNDKIRIDVKLTNKHPVREFFVYGTLGWGYRASLTDIVRDSSGKRISPKIFSDDLTPPISRNDISLFVKLLPRHFLGTYFVEELKELNLNKPGRYSIEVDYHSPISKKDVDLTDFWSNEDGVIKSNV